MLGRDQRRDRPGAAPRRHAAPRRRRHPRRRTPCRAGLRAPRQTLPRAALRTRARRRRDRHPRRRHQAHRRRARPCRVQRERRHRSALDRLDRTAAREDDRAAGLDACDARHLGAFQRLPHLPRDPHPADAARQHRYAGRLPLQAALPAPDPAAAQAGRPREPAQSGQADAGTAARLPDRSRGSPRRCRRHAAAHRQGVLVGGAGRRARAHAPRHHQCVEGRSLQDRHAAHVHGEHGLELDDEHVGRHQAC